MQLQITHSTLTGQPHVILPGLHARLMLRVMKCVRYIPYWHQLMCIPCYFPAGTDKYRIFVMHLHRLSLEELAEEADAAGAGAAAAATTTRKRDNEGTVSLAAHHGTVLGSARASLAHTPVVPDSLLVVDQFGHITFATWDLSAMLVGVQAQQLRVEWEERRDSAGGNCGA